MADYIVTSGELTTVANAIREKNGTSSNLSWPNGFVSGISSGGGGSSDFVSLHLDENFALNKTWQEISDLLTDGKILVVIDYTGDGGIPAVVSSAINSGGNYWVKLYQNLEGSDGGFYYASSANDYPVYD